MEVDNNADLTDEIMQMSTDDINFRSQMLGKFSLIFDFKVKDFGFSLR